MTQGIFRPKDFASFDIRHINAETGEPLNVGGVHELCDEVVNERLAPLVEALEAWERTRCLPDNMARWDEAAHNALTAYRALRKGAAVRVVVCRYCAKLYQEQHYCHATFNGMGEPTVIVESAHGDPELLRTQLAASEEKLRVAREALRDFVDECSVGASMGKSWKECQVYDDTVEQGRAALKAIGEGES